jgi:hypothetical protein
LNRTDILGVEMGLFSTGVVTSDLAIFFEIDISESEDNALSYLLITEYFPLLELF